MVRRLDLSGWRRRDHFLFFKDFEQPFWNVCTEVDVSELVEFAAREQRSFFLGALHASLTAANSVEEFRLRLRGDEVVIHDRIRGGTTILRDDETFGFGYFEYEEELAEFERKGQRVLEEAKAPGSLHDQPEADDLVYYSVLPWISFTSFAHARRSPAIDSNPRIVFGKRSQAASGRWVLPVSVEVHHALVDGLHVGRFLDAFQEKLRKVESSG